ncbi:MAG: DoxX family protein [Roseiflexaceae bacterium]
MKSIEFGKVIEERVGVSFNQIDTMVTTWMARNSITLLRFSIGVVFVWFGALKFWPGMSPAEDLVRATMPFLPGAIFLPMLAIWEILIGLGFISGRFTRATILLLLPQMLGTALPLILLPDRVFHNFPGLTLEGQYIIKNLVLVSAAFVIGATARGGKLIAENRA